MHRPILLASLVALGLAQPVQAADLLAIDRVGGRLHVVSLEDFRLRHSIKVGSSPHEVIASADGKRAYVAMYGDAEYPGKELVEVDLGSGEVVRRIDVSPLARPHGLARAGENIYFTSEMHRVLGRYNPGQNAVDRVLGIGGDLPHMLEIAADGQQLFTTDMLSGTVSHLDFRAHAGFPKLHSYPVGDKPEGLAIHPDGKQAWVGLNGEGRIAVLDLETGEVIARLPAGKQPARLEFSRDGSLAFGIDPHESRLLVFDVAGRTLRHSHVVEGVPLGMAPGARADRLFVTLAGAGAVAELDVATGKVLRRVDVDKVADGLAIAGTP